MRRVLLGAAAAAALSTASAAAQDVEMLSELTGRPLPAGYWERVRQNPSYFEHSRLWGQHSAAADASPDEAAHIPISVHGTLRMAVLMATFADSPEPSVTPEQVHQRLFGDNPDGNLTEFYRQISGGRLVIEGTVLPWVRTSLTLARVAGSSYALAADSDLGAYLLEVAVRTDSLTDFGQFDNDGPDGVPNSDDDDGMVDLAVFQFSQPAASCGVNGIWPHRASLTAALGAHYVTGDLRPNGGRILLDQYHIQSAVNCDGTPQSISIIAHETGHAFGLPDFYDAYGGLLPANRRWVMGCFALMAAGGWGCGDGAAFGSSPSPSLMGPYERYLVGWADIRWAEPGWRREYTLQPAGTTGEALAVPLRATNEYLLLEYRPNTGYDAYLPAGGILVYHVDETRPMRHDCNGCRRPYHISLVEADGDEALLRTALEGGNRGVGGDVFTGRRVLDDHSTPHIRQNSGVASNVRIEMEVLDGRARFIVSMLPVVPPQRLLPPLLASAPTGPTADERAALDQFGNRNGRYDLGDLRAYMRSRPGLVTPS